MKNSKNHENTKNNENFKNLGISYRIRYHLLFNPYSSGNLLKLIIILIQLINDKK